jgi:hypothetical protein
LISNLILKLEIKFLDNINKISVWKSVYILSFFINTIPKFLFMKIDRLHKDSFYNLLIYFYIPRKFIYSWLFNFMKLITEKDIVTISFLKDLSIGFNDLHFINFYELKSELFKWKQTISFNIIGKNDLKFLLKISTAINYKDSIL